MEHRACVITRFILILAFVVNAFTQIVRADEKEVPTVLVAHRYWGGDGGSVLDDFLGRDVPNLVIYTDGRTLYTRLTNTAEQILESKLSQRDVCRLLRKLNAAGFFDVKQNGEMLDSGRYDVKDIDVKKAIDEAPDGAPVERLEVYGERSNSIDVYVPFKQYMISALKQSFREIYVLSGRLRGRGYKPDKVLLWVEPVPEDQMTAKIRDNRRTWPKTLSELRPSDVIYLDEGMYGDHAESRAFEGRNARTLIAILGNQMREQFLVDGANTYLIAVRPVLPNEIVHQGYPSELGGKAQTWPAGCSS